MRLFRFEGKPQGQITIFRRSSSGGSQSDLEPECMGNLADGGKARVAGAGERLVEAHAGQAGLGCQLGDVACACNVAEGKIGVRSTFRFDHDQAAAKVIFRPSA
mgnify:CR=1 FL=1